MRRSAIVWSTSVFSMTKCFSMLFIAKYSPVCLKTTRKTFPKAPFPRSARISKSACVTGTFESRGSATLCSSE